MPPCVSIFAMFVVACVVAVLSGKLSHSMLWSLLILGVYSHSDDAVKSYDFITNLQLSRFTNDILNLKFSTFNQTVNINLLKNNVYVKDSSVHVISENETTQMEMPNNLYHGTLVSNGLEIKNTWARLVISDLDNIHLQGVVKTPFGMLNLQTISAYTREKRSVISIN